MIQGRYSRSLSDDSKGASDRRDVMNDVKNLKNKRSQVVGKSNCCTC
jgi:hypothetical protein